jgi:DNA-binding transcriptional MerR regulator
MLTIGQLAAYAGVTARTVRHYHQVGLLPEPGRNHSGYRTYGADDVVRLIRVRTLADAGVPLARVQELLDADRDTFLAATARIDRDLREQERRLREHRRRIGLLAAGDSLAVPDAVADYLDRVRSIGVPERMVLAERDAWILVAARYPDRVEAFMADKVRQLEDPRTVRFYRLLADLVEGTGERGAVVEEVVDLLDELFEEAAASGRLDYADLDLDDSTFVQLIDSMAVGHDVIAAVQDRLATRGWRGWSRVERAPIERRPGER